ncbi:MAG: acetoacetate--CoA ligase [Acidobacteria bacterium]|nr:acetoacetate--CoA ligase [Acidobacteriota bacterium]
MDAPLWTPSADRIARANLTRFIAHVRRDQDPSVETYEALLRFSLAHPGSFWTALWDFAGVIGTRGADALLDADRMPGARFFPGATLNVAENMLRHTGDADALVFCGEDGSARRWSRDALRDVVSRCAQALASAGVSAGDRVAGYLPNLPETAAAALATAGLGAVWSSASPDFGAAGVIDRFGQVAPRVLLAADGYWYGGRWHDCTARLPEILAGLPSVEQVILVPYDGARVRGRVPAGAITWTDWLAPCAAGPIAYARVPFDHPLYILFSSGTTGPPKAIVHGAGGTLLQHLKEHQLHCDVQPGDRVFYFTTCGWMMWNWLLTALASGATLLLYDGSPVHPDAGVLFDLADREGITLFGTSARYLAAVDKAGLAPMRTHALSALRTITSTGSPLAPGTFAFVYRAIKADVHLASISGGTDIVSCFVLGNPVAPVWTGEIQTRGLGMAVEVFDDDGRPVEGRIGELVCTRPFPSMPLGFWNDPDGTRYHQAYFDRFPGVWHHGDLAEVTPHGGFVIHGRSDAVLNPGGVRIGTAEIYRQVDAIDEVLECLAVGQQFEGDERIVLFVRLRDGATLDDTLAARIRQQLRTHASPRHVPARIVAVADLPRTRSHKLVEMAVRDVIHGRAVRNREALANPEALELFRDLPELRT